MREYTHTHTACVWETRNGPCGKRLAGAAPLCMNHLAETVRIAALDRTLPDDVLARAVEAGAFAAESKRHQARLEEAMRATGLTAPDPDGHIYYVMLIGDRVKIGWSADWRRRVRDHRARPQDVLAVEPAKRSHEAVRHEQFHNLRLGRTEDFRLSKALLDHISTIRREHASLLAA